MAPVEWKTIDFLAGEQCFELMLELMKSHHSKRLFRTKKSTFDLAVEVFYPFYLYRLEYEITITWPKFILVCSIAVTWCETPMLNVATFLKTAVPGIRMTCTNWISESIWNEWLENKLDFDSSSTAEPWAFFAYTFPPDIGARRFQGRSRDHLLWNLEWYGKLMSWWDKTGTTEFYLLFLTEKIVWGFTRVTRWIEAAWKKYLIFHESALHNYTTENSVHRIIGKKFLNFK